ncbi:TetR/AcrR family transcriptional regulator [Bifidobacterium sp. ESL0732]|uniref:TetR/AcrR family transcriptional regulator n=1 Tax=Bifidobacterium sp. ESL0732 TaxID=2983222 RepID=UPI0023F6E789|nr:TetR/AcrR family transcriptional regulator [Bifidobacterium sp. ESL0732]WEV63981.1 TetR/AcrR family transcriptional regulator C-terminal domain-containing protein [Bifidobacterium sp. ESL0732]
MASRTEDLRYQKNQNAIVGAFLKLLTKKPLHRITVKELAALAQINRNTFYLHYSGIGELYADVKDYLLQQIPDSPPGPEIPTPKEMSNYVSRLIETVEKDRKIYAILFNNTDTRDFEDDLKDTLFKSWMKTVIECLDPGQETLENASLRLDFIKTGIIGIFRSWMREHPDVSAETISTIISDMYAFGWAQIKVWE